MEADRLIAVGNLLISLATAIGLVVSTWLLNGKIDKLNGKFDRLTGRVDALETSHTAHVNADCTRVDGSARAPSIGAGDHSRQPNRSSVVFRTADHGPPFSRQATSPLVSRSRENRRTSRLPADQSTSAPGRSMSGDRSTKPPTPKPSRGRPVFSSREAAECRSAGPVQSGSIGGTRGGPL